MRIYLAGPLFTTAEREFNAALAARLRLAWGFEVFLPQELEQKPPATARSIFESDVQGIRESDIVVANMDGSDPDSGTCWECGCAYASSKRVILFRTDMRSETPFGPYNLMLHQAADDMLDCRGKSIEDIAYAISAACPRPGMRGTPERHGLGLDS